MRLFTMEKALSFGKISLGASLIMALLSVVPLRGVAQTAEFPGIIVNSGSTNTCPYTITVEPSGHVTYTVCNTEGSGDISELLANKFFYDIFAARPLQKLPYKSCAKSVSFGTTTKVEYKQQTSPDVSCPSSDLRVTDLYNDARDIQQELGFSTNRR